VTGVWEGVAARAIAFWTDGLGVGTHGRPASGLVALVSASFSPTFFRFAFFGLGLPFVSCRELSTQRKKIQIGAQEINNHYRATWCH
jgi:hypothetical protein